MSIPPKKILSYQCYQNGFEAYKEAREKRYLFAMIMVQLKFSVYI